MIKPITPAQARAHIIPDFVVEIVNRLIVENLRGGDTAIVAQKDILDRLEAHPIVVDAKLSRQEILDKHWLDFEPLFGMHWDIEYEKPGYYTSFVPSTEYEKLDNGEEGEAYFTFKPLPE